MANLWTLARVFHRSAREHPGHTMVVAGGNKQSYAQVDARSSSLAAAMSELGLGAGDLVPIILPNRPEWIVALLACAKLGATAVPVNPRLNYHELKYQLRHAESPPRSPPSSTTASTSANTSRTPSSSFRTCSIWSR